MNASRQTRANAGYASASFLPTTPEVEQGLVLSLGAAVGKEHSDGTRPESEGGRASVTDGGQGEDERARREPNRAGLAKGGWRLGEMERCGWECICIDGGSDGAEDSISALHDGSGRPVAYSETWPSACSGSPLRRGTGSLAFPPGTPLMFSPDTFSARRAALDGETSTTRQSCGHERTHSHTPARTAHKYVTTTKHATPLSRTWLVDRACRACSCVRLLRASPRRTRGPRARPRSPRVHLQWPSGGPCSGRNR